MARIHLLEDHLISQIAAGEVVERPASVVKELVENALDAGATSLTLDLDAGGKSRIRVVDDGTGMGRDDALLAFDRHATSKIRSFEDLARVNTLGFRGEALASIAAVARVELTTAEEPGEGQRVRIDGGRIVTVEPTPRPRGTTLEVASLFFNVPARRKFLKRPQTELRRCLEVVQGYLLARPDLQVTLAHEGRELLQVSPTSDDVQGRRERIGQLFGPTLAHNLVPLPSRQGMGEGRGEEPLTTAPQASGAVVSGLVGNRETTRGRRLFVFVNRRLLRDRAILATFYRSVRDEWKGEDFPALFLFLDLPPEDVDVNVHPQKSEVRFRDSGLLGHVEAVLRQGLAAARGEEPAPLKETVPATASFSSGPGERSPAPLAWRQWQGEGEARRQGSLADSGEVRESPFPSGSGSKMAEVSYTPLEPSDIPLSGRGSPRRSLRLLGQYKGTVVLLEGPDGLYLVDQHVAHERILYERFRRSLRRDRPESQTLLTPILLELAPAEAQAVEEVAQALEARGFSLSSLSGGSVGLVAIPSILSMEEAEKLLLTLATQLGEKAASSNGQDLEADLDRYLIDSLAASQACRAAVKMHHPLSAREMETLIEELFEAEQPYACPHGRPIVLRMTDSDLERRFGRR